MSANAFFRAGMIETWGRGIERIIQACRAAGTSSPEFRSEESGLWVPRMSLPEVAARIGKSSSAVERAVAKLVRDGRLTRVAPDKGGRWEVPK